MYVSCPSCKGSYYAVAEDFIGRSDSYFRCPFCTREFTFSESDARIEGERLRIESGHEM
jgi:predicted Zn finger-like uncharacterized protein